MRGHLVLEDGTVLEGDSFGASRTAYGEIVFNTNMTGYCEALTDPSYRGQILMMTYPLIGNYGVNPSTFESPRIQPSAFVVRECCEIPSHRTSRMGLHQFLRRNDVPGIANVDTRMLTIKIREHGTMKAAVCTAKSPDTKEILERVREMPHPTEGNLVSEVSCRRTLRYGNPNGRRVVLMDYGVKRSIIDNLASRAEVIRVPYSTSAERILEFQPDGVLISNGPGDPAHPVIMDKTAHTVKRLVGEVPIMGICLGHQILALSFGAETFKLKFGHRGGNHPVIEGRSRKVRITSQNHGFAVVDDVPEALEVTERNLNDGTIEGLRHKDLPIFSVQYHPEASPGPRDSLSLFDRFIGMMEEELA
ncbi:MAG: glutamine-hydrolyzing carbamoyl-phosphate synthase small subunit [Thermoplasmata archaeon]